MKICVCLHLFYWDMISEMKSYLSNLKKYDLFITTPVENKQREKEICDYFGKVNIIYTENEGFDVYPFLCFLQVIDLENYDLVVKLHTKKDIPIEYSLNGFDLSNGLWRYYLLDGILGDLNCTERILKRFQKDKKLGMIGAGELIIRDEDIDKDIDMLKVESTMQEMGLGIKKKEFIAGSMFIVRARLLGKLKERNFTVDEFPPYFPRDWNGLPYCLERCFGCMVSAQGYKLDGVFAKSTEENKRLYLKKMIQKRCPKLYRKIQKIVKE